MADFKNAVLCGRIDEDIRYFKDIFARDDILRIRTVSIGKTSVKCAFIYMDGMVNNELVNESLVRPVVLCSEKDEKICTPEYLEQNVLFANDVKKATAVEAILQSLLYGDTIILTDGSAVALTVNTKGFRTRGISEPADERVLQGPREGFDETAMLNIAMIRRKLLTPDLCVEMMRVGRRSATIIFVCYLGSLADNAMVKEVKNRIKRIDIDGILDSNYISEHIRDHKTSLFKTVGTTERPDVVAAGLLEGRIAVVVDGTPVVLTLPYLFSENFQSDEDYYLNYLVSSVGRALRYLCFFIAVGVPALFLALTTFHLELLPTSFALSVAKLRGGVPMPSAVECIVLILVFEILKETGVRMPSSLGHALSIVGGLVVGQAAVEAGIVSAPMLIAVALSGIAGLMIPKLKGAVFYLRLFFVLASAFLGVYGFMAVFAVMIIRILSLDSFGVDYTASLKNPTLQNLKDTVIRGKWTAMRQRPIFNKNITRKRDDNEK